MKENRKEVSGTIIDVDLFGATILVVVCQDIKTFLSSLHAIYKKNGVESDYSTDYEMLKDLLKGSERLENQTITLKGIHKFECIVTFNAPNIAEVSYEIMVHEFCHVMQCICKCRGIDDNETEAYLIEYLFASMLDAVDDYKNKSKKSKKKA